MLYQDGTETNGLPGRRAGFQVGITSNPDRDYLTSWGYDVQGRWETVGIPVLPSFEAAYSYEPDSHLLSGMSYSSASTPFAKVDYGYEPNRNVKTTVHNQRDTGTGWEDVSRYGYRYDALARRTDVVNTGPAFAEDALSLWAYNTRSEVIGQSRHLGTDPDSPGTAVPAQDFAYDYDAIGNRLESSAGLLPARDYTSNALNQYTAITNPSESPAYDLDGNTIFTGGEWHYAWNGENRLIEARDFDNTPVNGSKRLSFLYDYMGRRAAKVVEEYDGADWAVVDERIFLYQGWNLILEIDGSQDILKGYLWGMDLSGTAQGAGGVGGLLGLVDLQENIAAVAFYDANGNLTQLYDWINEETIAHYEYNPFGEAVVMNGSYAEENVFRFSTKYLDAEVGLYYYGFRYYDPEMGRWLNRDPIGERGGFVGNMSVNAIDKLGLQTQGIHPWMEQPDGTLPGPNSSPLRTYFFLFDRLGDWEDGDGQTLRDLERSTKEYSRVMETPCPDKGSGWSKSNVRLQTGENEGEFDRSKLPYSRGFDIEVDWSNLNDPHRRIVQNSYSIERKKTTTFELYTVRCECNKTSGMFEITGKMTGSVTINRVQKEFWSFQER